MALLALQTDRQGKECCCVGELINGKTPEQIKEALCICTSKSACALYRCPYMEYIESDNCKDHLMRDALELIKQLEVCRDAAVSDLKLISNCFTCSNTVVDELGRCKNSGGGGSPFTACPGYVWDKARHEPPKEEK